MYLQRKPSPIARPTTSQSRVLPSGCTARQPAISAHIQQSTSGGSIVISTVPMPSSGVALTMSSSQNAGRAPISRARNRSVITLKIAANSGEKNRTPNAVSPKMCVLTN